MNYNNFCEELKASVQSAISKEYLTSLMMVNKLNGISLKSLIIMKDGENIAPNIYLEEYYNDYLNGKTLDLITSDIINKYFDNCKYPEPFHTDLMNFNQVRDKIFFKLINYDKNIDYLHDLPHIKWMDLAIIFCILIKKDSSGIGSVNVKKDMLDYWHISVDELMELAKKNTPQLFHATVKPMNDIIKELFLSQYSDSEEDGMDDLLNELLLSSQSSNNPANLYVATNTLGINGSSWLLYDNALHSISKELNCDLYILPSSIHETILIPARDSISVKDLKEMVHEVNATQVPIQEILSENIYMYNYKLDNLVALF